MVTPSSQGRCYSIIYVVNTRQLPMLCLVIVIKLLCPRDPKVRNFDCFRNICCERTSCRASVCLRVLTPFVILRISHAKFTKNTLIMLIFTGKQKLRILSLNLHNILEQGLKQSTFFVLICAVATYIILFMFSFSGENAHRLQYCVAVVG